MERILEPEVMDTTEDAREYNAMDHNAVNEKFYLDLAALVHDSGKRFRTEADPGFDDIEDTNLIGSLLDVGTGTALIPIELCNHQPGVRVMAIDLAASMLDLAITNIDIAGMRSQIQLAQIDAKDSGLEDDMFDAVISNSIVHHIPNPASTFNEMARVTRPGGVIFVRDLMRPESETEVDHIVETYAGEETEYSRRLFRDSLCASLTVEEVQQFVADAGCDPQHVRATSDRHWTWATVR